MAGALGDALMQPIRPVSVVIPVPVAVGGALALPILVVDDHEDLRRFFGETLTRAGFDVFEAENGGDALRIVGEEPIGLILLDVQMPGLSGLEVLATLRSHADTATIPVILITGSVDPLTVEEGLEAGANDFLTKPVRVPELVARVRAHVRSQTAWTKLLRDELHARAGVVSVLGHIKVSGAPDEAAAAVVGELAMQTTSDFVAVLQLAEGNRLQPLATYALGPGVSRGGPSLSAPHIRYLLSRARAGPWAESSEQHGQGNGGGVDLSGGLSPTPLGATAGAPIYAANRLVGLFMIGVAADAGTVAPARQAKLLAAAIDYASIFSAVAGPAIADRRRTAATRATLQRGLTDRAFYPVFQPIVEMPSRRVIGFEALTRFRDGVRPDTRFAEATSSGLGFEYETAAIEEALKVANRLPMDALLSLNASPEFVLEGARLKQLLDGLGRKLVVELTEHARIDDYRALRAAIGKIGGQVRIAVDDAGAGYASLRHIVELKPAFAKLDLTIVRGIQDDKVRQALVAGLQYFAAQSDCRLIAEGVETDAEADTLQSLGIPLAQGYLFGRPTAIALARPAAQSARCPAAAGRAYKPLWTPTRSTAVGGSRRRK